jgi:hypothetical protein
MQEELLEYSISCESEQPEYVYKVDKVNEESREYEQ